jgi:hypothetical protein
MADKKISEMTAMIASEIANDDDIVISDTSANHTKRTPISELATFFGVNTEGIQDTVASMFTGGTMNGLSATYDDPNGVMNFSIAGGVTTTEMGFLAGTTSDIQTQFNSKAPIASPTFTGTASAPTASANDNTTKIATTAYVQTELGAYGADTATFTNKSGNISQWTNNSGYITASSTDTLTNKSGNISQWTNNANYETPSSTATLTNKSINGSNNTITNIPYTALSAIADEDLTTVSGNHDTIPSAKATKDYVDTQISGIDSLAEANDSNISSPSSGQILVHDGVDSFDNQTSSVTLSGAVTGTANMDSSGDFAITTTIPTNTITINGQSVALGGSTTIPSVLQSGGTFTGELHLNDNVTLSFGGTSGSGDLEILHDTNNSVIKNGTGELRVLGDTVKLKNNADNATFASFTNGGASELYHNNTKVLETTATGITVTSTVNGRNIGTDGTKLDTIANGAEVNVQANWSETDNANDAFIQNKPTLATVATSGSYNDLSNTPTIPTNNNQLTNGAGYTTNTGTLTQVTSGGATTVSAGNGIGLNTGNGTITMSGSYSGSFQATGHITAYSSDVRLKEFKGQIENALDKVNKLSGHYYEWNDTAKNIDPEAFKDGVEVGVIAQEVEQVMPELVTEAPIVKIHNLDTDYKTVHYDKLVPLLIEAIKELKSEIEQLKKDS